MRDLQITGLTADSRQTRPGDLFAALTGSARDGRDFIADALGRGAVAVLADADTPADAVPSHIALLLDDNPRRRLALMAAAFFGPQPRHIAAVTGTNGKTSVVSFARQIWARLGHPAASLGTLGIEASQLDCETLSLTTPDPVALIREIAKLADRGITHLAIEASSHGLAQYRVDGVRVSSAAFTNLSRDHLDYHDTMASYFAAKMRLFEDVMAPGGAAIINADAPEADALTKICQRCGHQVTTYGRAGIGLRLDDQHLHPGGQILAIRVQGQSYRVDLPLAGAFQAMNVLAALGLVLAEGADREDAIDALSGIVGVRGRLERINGHSKGAAIYVDYAHTPDALATVLSALRPHTEGRLICIFGAGGDRDPGKRPLMGGIAARLADLVIVTDDNPRSEQPANIRAQILAACPGGREIGDRATAIRETVALLRQGDTLLIAGKGHERGQIVGDRIIPFDDADVARAALGTLDGGP